MIIFLVAFRVAKFINHEGTIVKFFLETLGLGRRNNRLNFGRGDSNSDLNQELV